MGNIRRWAVRSNLVIRLLDRAPENPFANHYGYLHRYLQGFGIIQKLRLLGVGFVFALFELFGEARKATGR